MFANGEGIERVSVPATGGNGQVLDANGESAFVVGPMHWADGGTHTVSAAGGGKILGRVVGTSTFADAASRLRVGIQDVTGTPLVNDDTFDVYKELVGGTDPVVAFTDYVLAMGSGSKTIAHGAIVAIGAELTVRGGSDAPRFGAGSPRTAYWPYSARDSGSGPVANSTPLLFTVVADDGTLGWVAECAYMPGNGGLSSQAVVTGATNEAGAAFTLRHQGLLVRVGLSVGSIALTDAFDILLYRDPFGTPSLLRTYPGVTGLSALTTVVPNNYHVPITPIVLMAGESYAVICKATTGTLNVGYVDMGSGNAVFKGVGEFGTSCKLITRSGGSGAFAETDVTHLPWLSLRFAALDNGIPALLGG